MLSEVSYAQKYANCIDSLAYICGKIGFTVHDYNEFIEVRCTNKIVEIRPCERNGFELRDFKFDRHNAYKYLMRMLKTQTFAVKDCAGRLANPFYKHEHILLDAYSVEEFKINADLVFPNDISMQVISFFHELQKINDEC